MTETRIGFIITFFKTSEEGYTLLKKNIEILSKENYYLILASHSPIDIEIQKMCDYYFYQEKNVVDDRKYSHGVAESNLIEISLNHLRNIGIEWTCKASYDIEINNVDRFLDWRKDFKYDFVSCNWGDNIICTNSFFSKVDFLLDNITFYKDIDHMFSVNTVLENCWEIEIRQKDLVKNTFAFNDKQEFYGENKIDKIAYDYNSISFTFDPDESKFYITNNSIDIDSAHIRIFDYYTDLCICKAEDFGFNRGVNFWISPPFPHYLPRVKNGFYLEAYIGDKTIRKNTLINDFNLKHSLSKKFKNYKLENLDNNFGYLNEIDDLIIEFDINLDNISNFVDVGANFGIISSPFIEENKKVYLIDADRRIIELLKNNFSLNKNISIIEKAIHSYNGTINFLEDPQDTMISKIDSSSNEGNMVECITPNELILNYIDEEYIDLMKIDIEGSEYDFFETISEENIKRIKRFIIEFHNNYDFRVMKILEKLTANNFTFKLKKNSLSDKDYIVENQTGIIYAYK